MRSPERHCRSSLRELGELIYTARTNAGFRQHDVEEQLELSGGYMSTLETNRKNAIPTVETIARVANAVEADLDAAITLVLRARLLRALAKTHGDFTRRHTAGAAMGVAELTGLSAAELEQFLDSE